MFFSLKENGLLEDIYLTPRGIERARRSWLRPWISPYFDSLVDRKYRKSTLAVYANRLLSFGEFLEQRGACDIVDVRRWVEPFLQQRGLPAHRTRNWRSTLDRFVRDLVRQQAIPAPASLPPVCPHIELVEDYACFLREQRGAGREGLSLVRRNCSALLIHLAAQGISDLSTLTPPVIHGFITDQGQRYARKTLTHICSSVRGFLTYLYRRRVVPRDLGPVVVAPRLFRHEQCPRFLTRPEVEAVLATIDRQEARGRRDYAMGSCEFCAHGEAGRDFLKSASSLRVSFDGNAGGTPCGIRVLVHWRLLRQLSVSSHRLACLLGTASRFTRSALEGSDQ